ncbi:MAG TPA: YaaR family protein [Candidatus Rifleibacterium sp.]|nr:YaaR family protein [Candidatus Rifleibacterium sp.]HPT44979.1 YaaR family protein [Candidatus Rifleibacterium sp.]
MPVKIDNRNIDNRTGSSKPAGSTSSSGEAFRGSLKDAHVAIFNGNMKELIEVVKARGEKFVRNPEEGLLNSYKESVKLFLNKLKEEFLSLKEEFGAKRDGEQKVYQTVQSVESEVNAMTREALSEGKAIDLLASLDDIRGLVLDVIG